MNRNTFNKAFWLSFAFVFSFLSTATVAQAQTNKPPLMQDIQIKRPRTTPTPLVKRTGSSAPTTSPRMATRRTRFPMLADVAIPGYSGVVIESLDGATVMESYSTYKFNPASNVKVATGYAVLKTFGPNYRFATNIWTDGGIDKTSGTLVGNLYVSGRDPIFNYEHAVAVTNELNRLGIRRVEGDLIVTNNFAMNFSTSQKASANSLKRTMNGGTRPRAAAKAWNTYLANSGKYRPANAIPSVLITGGTYVEGLPSNVRILFAHESAPLREIVKVTLSYSNNFLSHRLGDMVGGAYGVGRIVQRDARVPASEFTLATTSGLGINRVSPRAQISLLRVFRRYLSKNRMKFSDVMPVAGLDEGTLRNRFKGGYIGSVVGKTGTLGRTDGGVSTLSGEITTASGKFLFVIFNQRGGVRRFRSFQNSFVPLVQGVLGGPRRMSYIPKKMSKRLATSRIRYPRGSSFRGEE